MAQTNASKTKRFKMKIQGVMQDFGLGVNSKNGGVHKNFISFVSMVTWREALLQGVWMAAAPPRTEESLKS